MDNQTVRMRLQRHAWFAAIVCLHLAAFMAWRNGPTPPLTRAQREGELLLLHLPGAGGRMAQAAPAAAATRRAAPLRRATASSAARAIPDTPLASLPADAATPPAPLPAPVLPDDPFARPAAPALDTIGRARLAAGGIDRQLRKESLNRSASIVDRDKADRYSIHGPAYRPPPPPESFADGRGIIHKRYLVRGKMVCETVDHVSPEAIAKGSQARYVKCPE